MDNLYGKVDEFKAENLINDIAVTPVTKPAKIKKASKLERGTILSKDAKGYYKKFNGAGSGESAEKPDCILADDIDNPDEDVFAVAYATGMFNRKALIFDGELSEAAEEILREKGIILKDNVEVK